MESEEESRGENRRVKMRGEDSERVRRDQMREEAQNEEQGRGNESRDDES